SKEKPLLTRNLEKAERITLNKSYRSTEQIVEFKRYFAPGEEEIIPFNREGSKPQLITRAEENLLGAIQHQIDTLTKNGHESIAIICKTMEETNKLYNGLKGNKPIHLIHEETYMFQKGVVILPVYLAKGIEFDAVIIPDASNDMYGEDTDRSEEHTSELQSRFDL